MVEIKDGNFKLLDAEDPLLSKHLSLLWGKPEFNEYMGTLLNTAGTGRAAEFSATVLEALLELSEQHRSQHKRYG